MGYANDIKDGSAEYSRGRIAAIQAMPFKGQARNNSRLHCLYYYELEVTVRRDGPHSQSQTKSSRQANWFLSSVAWFPAERPHWFGNNRSVQDSTIANIDQRSDRMWSARPEFG